MDDRLAKIAPINDTLVMKREFEQAVNNKIMYYKCI